MRHRLLTVIFAWSLWLAPRACWAVPDTTMSITPTCSSGTTITCSDNTTRMNNISSPYNSHSHTDIPSTTANTFTVGNGLAGSKSFAIDNEFTTTPSIRYLNTTGVWQFANDASTFVNFANLGQTTVTIGAGTSANQSLAVSTTYTTNPSIRYSYANSRWELSNDATTFNAIDGDISARVFNSADESIANATDTIVTFDSERFDTNNIHSTTTNTGRLIAGTAGKYLIIGQIQWAGATTGDREIYIRLNGTTLLSRVAMTSPGTDAVIEVVSTYANLVVGDYVELLVRQASTASLAVTSSAQSSPEFMMVKLP